MHNSRASWFNNTYISIALWNNLFYLSGLFPIFLLCTFCISCSKFRSNAIYLK
jgi:hypothetical protein